MVVDPRRDIRVYLDIARTNGMRIVSATETHIHADLPSGAQELAAVTGTTAYVSNEARHREGGELRRLGIDTVWGFITDVEGLP